MASGSSDGADFPSAAAAVETSINKLLADREKCSALSELARILGKQEARLLRQFGRVLLLKRRAQLGEEGSSKGGWAAAAASVASPDWNDWLRVVNVVELHSASFDALSNSIGSLTALLKLSDIDLEQICDRCKVYGESRRRFVQANRNLRNYVIRWIESGSEPLNQFQDSDLYWFSYDREEIVGSSRALPRSPTSIAADHRHSMSESGLDSGASDSGVGSNVSQTSLPTTTPPPSPGYRLLLSSGSAAAATLNLAGQPQRVHLGPPGRAVPPTLLTGPGLPSSRTGSPPAVHKWSARPLFPSSSTMRNAPPIQSSTTNSPFAEASSFSAGSVAAGTPLGGMMTRSRSHESNLPNRVGGVLKKPTVLPPFGRSPSSVLSRSTHESLGGIASNVGAFSVRADGQAMLKTGSSVMLSPTSPGLSCGLSMPFHDRTSSGSKLKHENSNNSGVTFDDGEPTFPSTFGQGAVPRSPRTGRLMHNIPHQWKRRKAALKSLRENCIVCKRPLGLTVEKCKSCKVKVHPDCTSQLGEGSCGLTPNHLKEMIFRVFTSDSSWNNSSSIGLDGQHRLFMPESKSATQISSIATPTSSNMSFRYPTPALGADSVESSSSTNSSAPSTPALFKSIQPLRSPRSAQPSHSRKFTFPDVPELPDIVLPSDNNNDDANLIESQGSDTTVRIDSEQPITVLDDRRRSLERTRTASPLTESSVGGGGGVGDEGSAASSYYWQRDKWSATTVRDKSSSAGSSWRDVRISYGDIQFQEDSLIGKGCFGEVHKGYVYQPVAVKFLNMDHVDDDDNIRIEAFKQEVAPFKNTRHENIILFVGYCVDPPYFGIVMNYCKGKTLHSVLHDSKERLDLNRYLNVAAQICQGMSYLHTKRILHKDLRSKNIFLEGGGGVEKGVGGHRAPSAAPGPSGGGPSACGGGSAAGSDKKRYEKVVITDFGLFSMKRLRKLKRNDSDYPILYVPDHWLIYLAPELIRSLSADADSCDLPFSQESDVYAFGTIWYELLNGKFPFEDQPSEAIVYKVGRGIKPPISGAHISTDLKRLLVDCWSYGPEERTSFTALHKMLERLPRKHLSRSPSHPVQLSRSLEAVF